jgi:hypothetical protein
VTQAYESWQDRLERESEEALKTAANGALAQWRNGVIAIADAQKNIAEQDAILNNAHARSQVALRTLEKLPVKVRPLWEKYKVAQAQYMTSDDIDDFERWLDSHEPIEEQEPAPEVESVNEVVSPA